MSRKWLMVPTAIAASAALNLLVLAQLLLPNDGVRPLGFQQRVELLLENWGVIPVQPFRHVRD